MDYRELFKEENEQVKERYELAIERIGQIPEEKTTKEPYRSYFITMAEFMKRAGALFEEVGNLKWKNASLEELMNQNASLYEDILPANYERSYGNPAFAVKELGRDFGRLFSMLYTEFRGMIVFAFEQRLYDLTILCELFIEIYNLFEDNQPSFKEVKQTVYFFISDYCDRTVVYRVREQLDPTLSFATELIMESDLSDLRYLYRYGEYITENERKTAAYLNSLPEEEIEAMAATYTEGYVEGFSLANIDLSKKKYVNIRYSIGFERMVRAAIRQFKTYGLVPVVFRAAVNTINKRQHIKVGYVSTSPNRQYDYDHRYDEGLYLDKAMVERKLANMRVAYEQYKKEASLYAGPAVIEIFGETPFEPMNKAENPILSKRQQELSVQMASEASRLTNEYIKREEYSFTIIAYPIPEIGENYEAIFQEIVKVNTLDKSRYKKIQQTMIDVLDQAEWVRVKGQKENKTNIMVHMHELQHPDTETNFENCLADVNIPVGEVFTSPMLSGTNGLLHVSEVYLNDLKFKDLTLTFQDGMIERYTCGNFNTENENEAFVRENLLNNRNTLPIGEFAIGTNTTAYVMANRYDIVYKLPILIVEKMGPHFAVGDTCYSYSEENRIYNPDGKEIVAKDNECSLLRKEDMRNAYFNCHTDITIPYDEIGEITAILKDGMEVPIICAGRFVLEGTLELNEAFGGNQ